MSHRVLRTLVVVVLLTLNVSCDQITKYIAREQLIPYKRIEVVSPYVSFIKVENSGAFLSLGDSLPDPLKWIVLIVLPFAALLYGLYYLSIRKHTNMLSVCGTSFIIGGGIGNLYDRIRYGSVTDFLHVDFVVFETGIFNLADVSIMLGIFMVIWGLRQERFDVVSDSTPSDKVD